MIQPFCSASLDRLFQAARDTPSDINEHLDVLRALANKCDRVAEFGMRWATSTTALLAGQPAELWTYDVDATCVAHAVTLLAPLRGRTKFRAICGSTLEEDLPQGRVDMLFVDSLHTYAQLEAELRRHARHVRRYLVFHDTVTFGTKGEDGTEPGLMRAIEDFRRAHPRWVEQEHYTNNNGLLVLERF